MRVTKVQRRALGKLSKREGRTAYDIQESIRMLRVLEDRGLVSCVAPLGSIFSPTTEIKWYIQMEERKGGD